MVQVWILSLHFIIAMIIIAGSLQYDDYCYFSVLLLDFLILSVQLFPFMTMTTSRTIMTISFVAGVDNTIRILSLERERPLKQLSAQARGPRALTSEVLV